MQMHLAPPRRPRIYVFARYFAKCYYHGQNCGLFKYSLTPSHYLSSLYIQRKIGIFHEVYFYAIRNS